VSVKRYRLDHGRYHQNSAFTSGLVEDSNGTWVSWYDYEHLLNALELIASGELLNSESCSNVADEAIRNA